ncbi:MULTISPECIES: DUF4265 domain-containing protein [Sorangium]|uniref:DUF4265 domain-containing protein n=1 Tax=Sorangium TaxID=39643 RepID=UPI0009B5F030|nr:DUF4265 domain-containing protein [Sorangium cellulosum]
MSRLEKVHFRLIQDEDGYPPIAVESLWAQPGTGAGEYILDNVPFFARDATLGDTVLVREDEGDLWFERLLCGSGNSLVRIVFFERSCVDRLSAHLTMIGCFTEYLEGHGLLAVSVPNTVDISLVQSYLQAEANDGNIDYEEPILRQ